MEANPGIEVRARIPADVDTPDRVLFGLTARQVVVLAAVAAPAYITWRTLQGRVPAVALVAATAPVAALAVAVAVGRRDGIGLDAWLLAAVRHLQAPHRLAPAPDSTGVEPDWAPLSTPGMPRAERGAPEPLRLPADAIGVDGVIETGRTGAAAVVAATTVNTGLLAGAEQTALVATYARWLNGLTGPVQIAMSSRRVDLGTRALGVARAASQLPSPALQQVAVGHAEFLLDLAEDRDPLARVVTITCTASTSLPVGKSSGRARTAGRSRSRSQGPGTGGAGLEAGRRAARTAQALAALGVRAGVLDGAAVTALVAGSVDPYGPGGVGWPRTPPEAAVTGSSPWARTGVGEAGLVEPDLVDLDPVEADAVEGWPAELHGLRGWSR